MAKRERQAMGTFLTSFASGLKEHRKGEEQKREAWVKCVLSGYSPENCSAALDFTPKPGTMRGMEGIREEQLTGEREEAKRQELTTDIATVEAGGRMSGRSFMKSLLVGEETPPETKTRLTSIMDYKPGEGFEGQFKPAKSEKTLISEARWLSEHPGATHEDYVKAMARLGQYGGLPETFRATHEPIEEKPGKWRPISKGEIKPEDQRIIDQFNKYIEKWPESRQAASIVSKIYRQKEEDYKAQTGEQKVPDDKIDQFYFEANEEAEKQMPTVADFMRERGINQTKPIQFKRINELYGYGEGEMPGVGIETKEPKPDARETYNKCRASGRSIKECKAEAGIE